MRNLIDRLELDFPIWSAGMGAGVAGPELVAAVAEAGGFGVLGAGGAGGDLTALWIERTRALTSRAFGVNLLLPLSRGDDVEACFDARVAVLVLFWGDVQPYVRDAHRRGMFVVAQCGGPEDAVAAADAGADAVILQGNEAGGHVRAAVPLAEQLSATATALGPLPVIAAGGLARGADLAAALERGAAACSLGTRFVATEEANAFADYKRRLVSACAEDTVLTTLFDRGWPDAPHRVLRNGAYERWQAAGSPAPGHRPGEDEDVGEVEVEGRRLLVKRYAVMPPLARFDGDLEAMPLYAGTSVTGIDDVPPAGAVVARLMDELRRAVN